MSRLVTAAAVGFSTAFAAALSVAPPAAAAEIFTSEAAFVAAAGSGRAFLPPVLGSTGSFTAAPFTFQSDPGQAFVIDTAQYGLPIPGEANLLVSGYESHTLVSPVALYAFGFNIFQPSNRAPAGGSTGVACYFACDRGPFTVDLFLGATLVDSFTFTPAFDTPEFHGYAGTAAFDRIRVVDVLRTIDDEYFSTYRFSTAPVVSRPVHAPAPWTLVFAAALAALAAARRPRRAARRR
jgi:hypothetical protein